MCVSLNGKEYRPRTKSFACCFMRGMEVVGRSSLHAHSSRGEIDVVHVPCRYCVETGWMMMMTGGGFSRRGVERHLAFLLLLLEYIIYYMASH